MKTERVKVARANEPRAATRASMSGRSDREKSINGLLSRLERERPGFAGASMRAGAMIRRMRVHAGLTQSELAGKLDVTQARVSELEAGVGKNGPSFRLLEQIADACGFVFGPIPDRKQSSAKMIGKVPVIEEIPEMFRKRVADEIVSEDITVSVRSFRDLEVTAAGQLVVPLQLGNKLHAATEKVFLEPVAITAGAVGVRGLWAGEAEEDQSRWPTVGR